MGGRHDSVRSMLGAGGSASRESAGPYRYNRIEKQIYLSSLHQPGASAELR